MTTKINKAVAHAILALVNPNLREKQVEVIGSFVSGIDVFGILPTGYVKNLCYKCLPARFDHLSQGHSAINFYSIDMGSTSNTFL